MKFAHIAPIKLTEIGIKNGDFNMVLAHIADGNDYYCELFKKSKLETLLDNGAFELGYPYEADKMVNLGKRVGADILVLPDYPGSPSEKGWELVEDNIKLYKSRGFKTMFVPQSEPGDVDGYLTSLEKALAHKDIDLIGLSILGCPTAFNKSHTLNIRRHILKLYSKMENTEKRFHMLGMLDYPLEEIELVKPYDHMINSWDSSAAVWAGTNGVMLDYNKKKFEKSVDFYEDKKFNNFTMILHNIERIDDAKRN